VVVELDGVVQFDFRDFEKSNSHLFVFGQDFFEGDGFQFSFFISVEPAFRFLGPQLGDRLIGLIGYVSNLEIIDTSGLTDLHIAHAPGGLIDKKFDLAYVLDRDPEYVVLTSTTDFVASGAKPMDFPIDQRIYEDERFTGTYRHLFTLDAGWREKRKGYFLTVFGRR